MKQNSVLIEDLSSTRSLKFLLRIALSIFVTGIFFYGVYNVLIFPVNDISYIQLESGNALCDCELPCKDNQATAVLNIDRSRLFYNRIPKCGSTTLYSLIRKLSFIHGFKHYSSKVYHEKVVDEDEQRRIVQGMKATPAPCSFDRHLFFINFTRFNESLPVYINVIREPVERIISGYYYKRVAVKLNRTKSKPSDYWMNKKFNTCVRNQDPECTFIDGKNNTVLQVPYFCGQEFYCGQLNNPNALKKAKQNIDQYYAVVGVLDHFNITLQVLQAVLPHFFGGVYNIYQSLGFHLNRNPEKEEISEEIKSLLRANLSAEYELYHFVQQRLYRQFRSIVDKGRYENAETAISNERI